MDRHTANCARMSRPFAATLELLVTMNVLAMTSKRWDSDETQMLVAGSRNGRTRQEEYGPCSHDARSSHIVFPRFAGVTVLEL